MSVMSGPPDSGYDRSQGLRHCMGHRMGEAGAQEVSGSNSDPDVHAAREL